VAVTPKVNNKKKITKSGRIAMTKPDTLDEIISQLDPEEVPTEFVAMAKIVTLDGAEKFITGAELEVIMANPEKYSVIEARVILDVQKIRQAIIETVEKILETVHADDAK
jgi:hypothetical protein